MNRIVIIVAVLLVAAAAGWWFLGPNDTSGSSGGLDIRTVEIEARDLSRIVTSSGSIAPLIEVEVGSQLSGQIEALEVDFNDTVEEGSILARLDPQTFESRVQASEASLEVAEAQRAVQQAGVTRAQANLNAAERAFSRAVELRERGTYSDAQYDTAEANFETARANLAVAQANLRNAAATLRQREATLESDRVDLERTLIRSPIAGVVIDRRVDVGSTVAASFNAPVLFVLAQNLSRIQIEAQIDEADIGQIRAEQSVTFDVDAYPDQAFNGTVTQVRLAAQNEQNVVTYTVVVEADNPRQRLLPGMTANVSIVTGQSNDVLTVPNAALRFNPRGAAEALVIESDGAPGGRQRGGPGGAGRMAALLDELDLSEEQRRDAEQALREMGQQMRQQTSRGPGGGRPDFQAMTRRALSDILTQEQLNRLQEIMSRGQQRRGQLRRGQVWVQTTDGGIRAVPVVVGLSDGQYTEIRSRNLQAGDTVITQIREQY